MQPASLQVNKLHCPSICSMCSLHSRIGLSAPIKGKNKQHFYLFIDVALHSIVWQTSFSVVLLVFALNKNFYLCREKCKHNEIFLICLHSFLALVDCNENAERTKRRIRFILTQTNESGTAKYDVAQSLSSEGQQIFLPVVDVAVDDA